MGITELRNRFPFLRVIFDECPVGWEKIVEEALTELSKLELPEDFKVVQINEKFGGLRIYEEAAGDLRHEVWDIIVVAEQKAFKTCQDCGGTENVTTKGRPNWITTLCEVCGGDT